MVFSAECATTCEFSLRKIIDTGNALARTTVKHVLQSKCNLQDIQDQIRTYHESIRAACFWRGKLDSFDKLINEDVPLLKETEMGYLIHNDIASPEMDNMVIMIMWQSSKILMTWTSVLRCSSKIL